jgi:4-cresol dehydrogenase (hydroxylating) flavoprotein subunit
MGAASSATPRVNRAWSPRTLASAAAGKRSQSAANRFALGIASQYCKLYRRRGHVDLNHDECRGVHLGGPRLGEHAVLFGAAAQQKYGACITGAQRSIPAALRPKSVEQVVPIVDIARRHAIPLYSISTGHNWGYGGANPVTDGCVILDLSGLNRILDIDPDLGLVTLEPGVTQQDLHDYLERNALPFLVPVTGAGPDCSLLGNTLERGYGITPHADHFAAVTAMEAVLPDGRIYRSALSKLGGGTVDRAFKWGIGPYLDGLFAQSNFAIITQMTIALAPRPERVEAFFFGLNEDAGLEAAVTTVRQLLRSLGAVSGSINLMNARRMLAMIVPYPADRVDQNGILPLQVVAELSTTNRVMAWTGLGALYGKARIVKAARRVVREVLKPISARLVFLTPRSASHFNHLLGRIPLVRHGRIATRARAFNAALQLIAGGPSQVALPLAYWKSSARLPLKDKMDPAFDGCGLL